VIMIVCIPKPLEDPYGTLGLSSSSYRKISCRLAICTPNPHESSFDFMMSTQFHNYWNAWHLKRPCVTKLRRVG